MPDQLGNVLPIYVLVDESASMRPHLTELTHGLNRLHESLLTEPMAAAKIRLSVLGFSSDVQERLGLTDLRTTTGIPPLVARGGTMYKALFDDLRRRIPRDIADLKSSGFVVHRPAIFLLTDGEPNDQDWADSYALLTDRTVTAAAPNIIACGIGDADAETLLNVATRPEYCFVAFADDVGVAVARFMTSLSRSVVASGRSLHGERPELVVERPEGFRMGIDVV